MSTYMYLRCEDHTPPLLADEESGQHWYDVPRIRQEIKDREALVKAWELVEGDLGDYFTRRTVQFLYRHQSCRIGIQTEYGEDVPLEEPEAAS